MGFSYDSSDWPQKCFNAAKMWQLGWFNARSKTLSSSGTTSYSGNIADMTQNPNDSSGSPIVIKMDTSSSRDYFLSFNRATGFNVDTESGANEVRIVRTEEGSGTDYSESYVKASLKAGESWTSDADFSGGQRVTVKVNSIGTTANVDICIGPCPTTGSSAPTLSPVASPPTPTPTPVGCVDFSDRFALLLSDGKRVTRSCSWVANKPWRCNLAGVSATCPVTCGSCSTCVDPDGAIRFRFEHNGKFIKRSCAWVTRKQLSFRCSLTSDACRASCGSCSSTPPTPTPPNPTPPTPTPSNQIQYVGNPCNSYFSGGKCEQCTGDCDSDSDCAGDLRCAQRWETTGVENVPGCSWGNADRNTNDDYCE